MANLKTIPGTDALVRAEHFDSIAAAFDELEAAAGFRPVVLGNPSDGIPGGARTLAQSKRAGSGVFSDHYEDNDDGDAAVDIDNWKAFWNAIGKEAFEAILAKHGWYNVQINGAPFPSEPWHFARRIRAGVVPANDGTRWDQNRLNAYGSGLVVDGIRGPKTIAAIRDFQSKHGLVVDGIAGPLTDAVLAKDPGAAGLTVDGDWGPQTTKALQRALGVTVDGEFGPNSTKALQRKLGVTADGDFGPISKRALQAHLGVEQDGAIGPITVRAMQTRLNAGTF